MSIDRSKIPDDLYALLEKQLGDSIDQYPFPPPVFIEMQGELERYDIEDKTLTVRFPVLEKHLNPYGSLQGGMIAAAIDNVIGPLSMLVSPPNFTRYMDVKYAKAIPFEMGEFWVTARFVEQKRRQLFFEAIVKDKEGNKLAVGKAMHWVI